MSKSEKTTQTSSGASEAVEAGKAQVQARFDEANAKGYFGTRPEGPDNESYTLAGVTKDSK